MGNHIQLSYTIYLVIKTWIVINNMIIFSYYAFVLYNKIVIIKYVVLWNVVYYSIFYSLPSTKQLGIIGTFKNSSVSI